MGSAQNVSVIIPALQESARIAAAVGRIRTQAPAYEVVVVDGGSRDKTPELARAAGAHVISAPRGRGIQCEAGGRAARGDLLLFLHADTFLPDEAFDAIGAVENDPTFEIGTFRLAFDHSHPLLRAYAWFTRFDSLVTRFGDQGILIRRPFLESIGGFPVTELFEDVELLRRARRRAHIRLLPATVVTSSRRFIDFGVVREQLSNARLMFKYLTGTHPNALAAERSGLSAHDGEPGAAHEKAHR